MASSPHLTRGPGCLEHGLVIALTQQFERSPTVQTGMATYKEIQFEPRAFAWQRMQDVAERRQESVVLELECGKPALVAGAADSQQGIVTRPGCRLLMRAMIGFVVPFVDVDTCYLDATPWFVPRVLIERTRPRRIK